MNTIGILGGLGPQTTATFYLDVVAHATHHHRPQLCIWSLPLNMRKEAEHIATGAHADHFLHHLRFGLQSLVRAGATHIVIPCNTVHEFHQQLQHLSPVPISNIVSLTVAEAQRRGWHDVLLLATSQTIRQRLFQHATRNTSVTVHMPDATDQRQLDLMIQGLLTSSPETNATSLLQRLMDKAGTDHVVLGCTDLQLFNVPTANVVDSMHTLALHAAQLSALPPTRTLNTNSVRTCYWP